jgi:hypothetical protein
MAHWRKILAPESKIGLAASAYVRLVNMVGDLSDLLLDLAALETGRFLCGRAMATNGYRIIGLILGITITAALIIGSLLLFLLVF